MAEMGIYSAVSFPSWGERLKARYGEREREKELESERGRKGERKKGKRERPRWKSERIIWYVQPEYTQPAYNIHELDFVVLWYEANEINMQKTLSFLVRTSVLSTRLYHLQGGAKAWPLLFNLEDTQITGLALHLSICPSDWPRNSLEEQRSLAKSPSAGSAGFVQVMRPNLLFPRWITRLKPLLKIQQGVRRKADDTDETSIHIRFWGAAWRLSFKEGWKAMPHLQHTTSNRSIYLQTHSS